MPMYGSHPKARLKARAMLHTIMMRPATYTKGLRRPPMRSLTHPITSGAKHADTSSGSMITDN
jgi:hypothetical protein